jgi:hypothetical protein
MLKTVDRLLVSASTTRGAVDIEPDQMALAIANIRMWPDSTVSSVSRARKPFENLPSASRRHHGEK